MKRVILVVMDSLGVGELPDANLYGDVGSHTLDNTYKACGGLKIDNLEKLGFGNIEGVKYLNKVNDHIAREMLVDENVVGRVIARPFIGKNGEYKRTSNRRDYALDPFSKTMLEYLYEDGKEVAAVGKIEDIYNKKGVTKAVHTKDNMDGVDATLKYMDEVKEGLIFTNLVDFDMLMDIEMTLRVTEKL